MEAGDIRGIRFPDRAEALGDFAGYKVFLDPWEPLAEDLRRYYDGVALRRESRILALHGPQGTGKTLFATKLETDFVRTKEGGTPVEADSANLWHRVTGGVDLNARMIEDATRDSDLLLIENQVNWVEATAEWLRHRQDRRCVVVADNAERPYFRQGLVAMTEAEYVNLADSPELTRFAAQRLVELCRGDFRGALFVLLSNDEVFLLALDEAVLGQHAGLLTLTQVPQPDGRTKETVVRVNTNRLNPVSYWFCLDKAGPEEKTAVKRALEGASNFPDSFQALDTAIRTATPTRIGRPARQNTISLFVLAPVESVVELDPGELGAVQHEELAHRWCAAHVYSRGWAPQALGEREASLIESEWLLRVVLLGVPFIKSLSEVANDPDRSATHREACAGLLEAFKTFHGPGTRHETRQAFSAALQEQVESWPDSETDLTQFWGQGQTRSQIYETGLGRVLAGYNTSAEGFLRYRPDFVVSPYRPCSILSAVADSQEAINAAIRRDAHVFEFTATNAYAAGTVRDYLAEKLPNYLDVTQEQ